MGRRIPEYKKRHYIQICSWGGILFLGHHAWDSGELGLWGLPMMAFGAYWLFLAPTRCRARTTRDGLCTHYSYGLLKGCRYQPSHGPGKRADLLRTLTGQRLHGTRSRADSSRSHRIGAPASEAVNVGVWEKVAIVFTIVSGIAGVVQTVLTAVSMS